MHNPMQRGSRGLQVSREALELYAGTDVFDLHVDSFIWARILRYDLHRRHRLCPLGRRILGQVDLPRAIESGLTGAMWSITTNPFRSADARQRAFGKNLARLKGVLAEATGVEHVRSVAEYRAARSRGHHGALIAVQGGHAFKDPSAVAQDLVRTTVIHQTSSVLGETSTPTRHVTRVEGLTAAGRSYVESCEASSILVDLAHASPRTFWDAVAVHDPDRPLVVTHTGVAGVQPSWRNSTMTSCASWPRAVAASA